MEPYADIGNYTEIEPFEDFARVVDPSVYRTLPDDWLIGVSDVVNSRVAIEEGRYRAVNMAGAAMISAVTNALVGKAFPFVFCGDGARLAIAPEDKELSCNAMVQTASWVRDNLDLDLRVGMASIKEVRDAGYDVRVARYAASPDAIYAMFSGGGVEWVERRLKSGSFGLAPASNDAKPDLTGLSCQWGPIRSKNGVILSMIVRPVEGVEPEVFAKLIREILATLGPSSNLNPVPDQGPDVTWPGNRLALQACTVRTRSNSAIFSRLKTMIKALIAWALFKTNIRIAGFDPRHYRHQIALNTDYRKYDDGLVMTTDCTEATMKMIERRLEDARLARVANYGLHPQETALMTCVAPSIFDDNHLHFLDGGDGGYAEAAKQMSLATRNVER